MRIFIALWLFSLNVALLLNEHPLHLCTFLNWQCICLFFVSWLHMKAFLFFSSIYKKAGVGKEKREVTYVVAKKGAGRKIRRPPGVKGVFRVVDGRMKKDLRCKQNKDQRNKGKGGSKGGKGGRGGKASKGRPNRKWASETQAWTPHHTQLGLLLKNWAILTPVFKDSVDRMIPHKPGFFTLDEFTHFYRWLSFRIRAQHLCLFQVKQQTQVFMAGKHELVHHLI